MPYERVQLCLDAESHRTIDENGFLRVKGCPLTKEQVAPYRGREIPSWQEHRLEPEKIYYVYRPASELSKPATIQSLNSIPIQLDHHIEDPDDPPTKTRVGATGESAEWVPPYLKNSLTFYNADAIKRIQDGSMKELSLGYRYTPDFTPGETKDGERYDLIMRDISANHLALVEEGRAGADVMVLDSALTKDSPNQTGINSMDEKQVQLVIEPLVRGFADSLLKAINGAAGGSDAPVEQAPANEPIHDADEGLEAPAQDSDESTTTQACDSDEEGLATAADEGEPAAEATPVQDGDDEQACDGDEENAAGACDTDEGEQACDEDELAAPTQDEDESPEGEQEQQVTDEDEGDMPAELVAALKESDIDPQDTEAVRYFAQGIKYAMKNINKQSDNGGVAGDSARAVKRTLALKPQGRMAARLNNLAQDAALYTREKERATNMLSAVKSQVKNDLRAQYKAADAVKSYLGNVDPLTFDSAGAIYKAALRAEGFKNVERMTDAGARDAFKAYDVATRRNMAQDSRAAIPSKLSAGNNALLMSIDKHCKRG